MFPVEFQNQIFSLPEAARFLKVSQAHLFTLLARGDLPRVKLGHRTVITGHDLARYIEAHRVVGYETKPVRRAVGAA